MKKFAMITLVLILALSLLFAFVACDKDQQQQQQQGEGQSIDPSGGGNLPDINVSIKTPTGAPSLALGALFNGLTTVDKLNVNYEVTSGSAVQAAVTTGNCDFAILPTFAGVQLSMRLGTYQLLATTSWGNLYFVTTDASIVSLEDSDSLDAFLAQFEGKHIDTIGGGKVDVAVKYILDQADVNYDMQAYEDASTITPLLRTGASRYAILGEPAATAATKAVEGARIVGSVAAMWRETTGVDFPQASIFVRKEFADANPQAVLAFTIGASASIDYFNASAANATEVANSLSMNGTVVGQCYPAIAQRYVSSSEAKESVLTFMSILGVEIGEEQAAGLFR